MTQKASVHCFGKTPCQTFVIPEGIVSQFSDFSVTQTGTGMPCYCIQWNVSDKTHGYLFQAAIQEERSFPGVPNLTTFAATHEIYCQLINTNTNQVISTGEMKINVLPAATGIDMNHAFGRTFEDTVAFYIGPHDATFQQASFFWYVGVQGKILGQPHPTVVAAISTFNVPASFTATDTAIEFVGITGDVQFDNLFKATVQLGQQVGAIGAVPVQAQKVLSTDPLPSCCTLMPQSQTSNATMSLQNVYAINCQAIAASLAPKPPPTGGA